MSTLVADLKFGVRMLLATPRVTAAALLSLALGIGATAAIFTVVNAVILRPLAFVEPSRLVAVWETSADNDRRWVAPANFLDWRRDARSFTQLAAYDWYSVNLTGRRPSRADGALRPGLAGASAAADERPERLRAGSVSGNFFSTLGVSAALGRTFTSAHDAPGSEPAVMLAHGAWQRLFGGNPNALGTTLMIDSRPHTLIGVLPQSFDFLGPDLEVITSGDRGIPNSFPIPTDLTQVRDSHVIYVVGRLAPSASVEQAQAEMTTIMRGLERTYPQTNTGLGARVVPLHEDVVAESRTALLLLLGSVGFLLLIACVNV
ncbi:MAG: ABC transporter permease, partial [Steroidobacteraceae bacterium]